MSPAKARPRSRPAPARTRDAQLDLSAVPEQPVAPPPKPAQSRSPPKTPKPGRPKPAPGQPTGGKGSVIQLGAFANHAQAERAWTRLSARFPSVAAMNKLIVPFSGGIRLRAAAPSPAEARAGLPGAQGRRRELLRGELMQAAIYGLAGPELTPEERDFFRDADPAGYILFKRNCETATQMRR